jgi:hypothetical protein
VFEEELGALEAFGELLADGLFDDAGAGEADERAGFGDVEVAEHGEAGGDAAGGGVGEDADVGDAASSSWARPVAILASCMRLTTPSIMRAPPEAETMMSGCRVASERSMARAMVRRRRRPCCRR